MAKRSGSYLEESVAVLFRKAGFNTKLNTWLDGYEIDVLAYKGDYKIAIECKHYENSHIIIRNILHQWASKINSIKVEKVVVVIAGQNPSKEDYKLAKELGIILVDDDKIHYLNSLIDIDKLKEELNYLIAFDKGLYQRKYKKKIIKYSVILLIIIAFFGAIYYFNKEFFYFIIIPILIIFIAFIFARAFPRRRRR